MTKGFATENFAQVEVVCEQALREWLDENHAQTQSVWLVTHKKSVPGKYVSREQVLDQLIAFGWIDGVRRKLDETRTMQLISPRKTQAWAKSYKDRAARLIDEGAMAAPGLAAIEAGKASGLWDFMDDVDALIVPDDLAEALDATPNARANYDAFPDSAKRFTLRWIKLAKTDATRAKRIATTAERAAQSAFVPGVKMTGGD